MEQRIDLDLAAMEIARRRHAWARSGYNVGPITWRDSAARWPPALQAQRSAIQDPASIGVKVRKGPQEGAVVLYQGGWADLEYWAGSATSEPLVEVHGWEDWLTVERFGRILDRFANLFR